MRRLISSALLAVMVLATGIPATATPPARAAAPGDLSAPADPTGHAAEATGFEMKFNYPKPRVMADPAAGDLREARAHMTDELRRTMKTPTPAQSAALASLNLRGSLVANYAWGYNNKFGVYTVPTSADQTPELIGSLDYDFSNGLVDFGNGSLVAVYYKNFGRGSYRYVYFYDTDSWTVTNYNNWPEMTAVSFGCALDPTSGEVYGVFFNQTGSGLVWGKADWENWKSIEIAPTDMTYMSVACDNAGQYYAISEDGTKLYTIDKTTGNATLLHELTIPTTGNVQGGCINSANNTYLQTYSTYNQGSGLIQIDLATGEQTLMCEYDSGLEYSHIYIPVPEAEAGAPAAPSLSVACNQGAMDVDITLTMPTTLYDGTDAAGMSFDYVVKAGETEVMTGSAGAGAQVEQTVTLAERGMVNFTASASNATGHSPLAKASCFVGRGCPAASASATLTWADGTATLTWEPVTSAIDEGYFDAAAVTYSVVNQEGSVVASGLTGTSYSFALPESDDAQVCKYGVKALNGDLESDVTYSNNIVVGSYGTPFSMDLRVEDNFYLHSVIDVNQDGRTWTPSDLGAKYEYNMSENADDWLFSPPVKLEAGKTYTFTSKCMAYVPTCPEKIEIKAGRAATVEAMTIPLVGETVLDDQGQQFEVYLTAPETGIYHIGFHALSDKDMFYLFVDNYALTAPIDVAAPDAVTDASVVPDPDGARKATVSYTAPAKTVLDTDIIGSFFVRVFRGETEINSQLVGPAQQVSFEDEVEENGTYDYRFVTYKSSGEESKSVSLSVLIGPRIPANPTNVNLVETGTDTFVLSWDAVTKDIDGADLNPENVTYKIYTGVLGDGIMPGEEVGTTTETSFTYHPAEHISQQQYLYLVVVAYNKDVRSQRLGYASVLTGDPYQMPILITNQETAQNYYYSLDGTGSFLFHNDESLEGISAYDDDNCYFAVLQRKPESETTFVPGTLHVAGDNPVLSFYIYSISAEDLNETTVSVDCDGTETELHHCVHAYLTPGSWNHVVVDLSQFADKDIKVRIKAKVIRYIYNLYDRIEVRSNKAHDLLVSATIPAKSAIGQEFSINATVTNEGSHPAQDFTVALVRDGQTVDTKSVSQPLVCGASDTYQFRQTLTILDPVAVNYKVEVIYEPDLDKTNNATAETTVTRAVSPLPGVTGLRGQNTADANIISWDEFTVPEPVANEVTDDIETAEPYAHALEGWTFIDKDRSPIGGFQGHTIPGIISGVTTASFVVFTSDFAAGKEGEELFLAHSGKQYLVSFYRSDANPIDDWAVSPLLTGQAQTISFYAKSFSSEYPETIGVYYTTSTDPGAEDYINILPETAVPFEWTLYTAELPAGAKHFAIRSCSPDGFMLMVDDIHYTRLDGIFSEHKGFNIYCEGTKANDDLHTTNTFTHQIEPTAEPATYTYHVTTVFEEGESELSEPLIIQSSSLTDQAALGNLSVTAANGAIAIRGAGSQRVTIAMVDGRVVYSGIGDATVETAPAVYLVTVGRLTFKLLVK